MSTPLESIRESVDLSNRFLAYVGIMALVFSSVIVYFTTKKITSPILKLANISERMSGLDFDVKYEGKAIDEIGVLGNNMNLLSDKKILRKKYRLMRCARTLLPTFLMS